MPSPRAVCKTHMRDQVPYNTAMCMDVFNSFYVRPGQLAVRINSATGARGDTLTLP